MAKPGLSAPRWHAANREPTTIALVQSSSLPMLVQKELERMILAGDLAAGAKFNEAAIADRLGVSRGPVREAFRALEESGLVRLEKNRGVFVRQITIEEADEIYEVRAALDEWVGRRLAERARASRSVHCVHCRSHGHAPRRRMRRPLLSPEPRFPRPAGRLCRQRQAARHLPAPGQRTQSLSGARRSRRAGCCRSRRASIATSSKTSPPATPRRGQSAARPRDG